MMKEQSTKTTRPQLQKPCLRTPEEYAKAEAQIREILKKAMPNSDPNFKGLIGELGDSGYASLCLPI
jgi:hypothetical protein